MSFPVSFPPEFDEADELFQKLSSVDPHNLEFMEPFSHVLYVKEDRARLSFLAHNAVKIDKYRSETCLIVGNFYSLRSEHEKAITYFKRALKLNTSNATTWILLGHEFLEVKNPNAAIEAYRRAVGECCSPLFLSLFVCFVFVFCFVFLFFFCVCRVLTIGLLNQTRTLGIIARGTDSDRATSSSRCPSTPFTITRKPPPFALTTQEFGEP